MGLTYQVNEPLIVELAEKKVAIHLLTTLLTTLDYTVLRPIHIAVMIIGAV